MPTIKAEKNKITIKKELETLQKLKQDLNILLIKSNENLLAKTDALLTNQNPEKNGELFLQFNNASYMHQKINAIWNHITEAINEANEANTLIARQLKGIQE